ncbi:GNAT family N-acetyltransferase [Alistipes sp.]|uniref:GNAT family N-acetyltransferase n=1 Tax=Alistipes sp. TaxID=1872444 RepID=UPI003A87BC79
MIRICEAHEVTEALIDAFARLLPQLSERLTAPDRATVARIVAAPATRQLTAVTDEGRIVGLLSVAFYDVPSGRKAWIEDVVVDAAARGRGVGEALVRAALSVAREEGAARVMLTSNAARRAAHRLYERMGFVRYETDCFRFEL